MRLSLKFLIHTVCPLAFSLGLTEARAQALRPIPAPTEVDMRLVQLGRLLFHDARLSLNRDVTCASCHPLGKGGADGAAFSRGTGGVTTPYNTPSILNAALVFKYGWEGAAATFSEATQRALESRKAMSMSLPQATERLRQDKTLVSKFGPLNDDSILTALMAYMQYMIPRSSPLDRFLQGDAQALSSEQKQGYQRFLELGCASCHQGIAVGGNMFVRFGVMFDPFRDQPDEHRGRYNLTQEESDRHVFRVPSLRNVALTAPYFHDGRAPDLASAIRTMGYVQLGIQLSDKDVQLLLAFLNSLTGEIPDGVMP
jgi:cytochrome c peroxidase